MDATAVIQFFGDVARTAKLLEVSEQAVYNWEKTGRIPLLRQAQIERASNGVFKAPPDVIDQLIRQRGNAAREGSA